MRELDFINIINTSLTKKSHLGDDCAYLKELEIVITQDSFVEGIHFSKNFSNAYEIGYKSIIVNISDILASGAKPEYITIALSLPKEINSDFIKSFYKACEDISNDIGIEVVGGDITGSYDKIFVSICAIGKTKNRNISSRKNAETKDLVVTTGHHGSSAAGLYMLTNNLSQYPELIKSHKLPDISNQKNFSEEISQISTQYAMMDTSDGLADALFKIAEASNKTISINFEKIPFNQNLKKLSPKNFDYKDWILYGGEDYQLIACIKEELLHNIKSNYKIIGEVKDKTENILEIKDGNNTFSINNLEKTYNHF